MLCSLSKHHKATDSRSPISEKMLFMLIDNINLITSVHYNTLLFSSMFLLAFYFGLRVGEMTKSVHNIQLADIKSTQFEITIKFKSFKHSKKNFEYHSIRASNNKHCPVRCLNEYLSLRGVREGPLFQIKGKAVAEKRFTTELQKLTKILGITESITSHSFRIGAASHWLNLGLSDYQIMKRGRWRSSAVLKYLRGQVDHTN